MTTAYTLDAAGAQPPSPSPPAGPPPSITANTWRLGERFRVMGFTIRTYGRPYFEVLLTTDRALFDQTAAARRTQANFYAGRQDGGLLRATAEDTAYIVPAAVLKRFAEAVPRPTAIYYTVAAYDRPDGPPVLALSPQLLATMAPSVLLGADYQSRAMAVVLGVPAEKLRPYDAVSAPAPVAAAAAAELDDDGYPVGEAMTWSSADDDAEPEALALDDEPVDEHDEWAQAAESTFPAGAAEPATLEDADEDRYEHELGDDDADFDEPYGLMDAEAPPVDEEPSEPYGYDEPDSYDEPYGEHEPGSYGEPYGAEEAVTDEEPDDAAVASAAPYDQADAYEEPYDYDEPYDVDGAGAYDATLAEGAAEATPVPLDIPAQIAIVNKLGRMFETPDGFTAASLDPRAGLRAGFAGFRGRLLGRLLRMMRERDPGTYRSALGTDADTLPGTEASVARLRAAGAHPSFQAAQNELAVRAFLEPMLPLATGLGLDTERALALLADRAMQMGPRRARQWIVAAIGPIRTDAQRQQALGALGFPTVLEFQRASGVMRDGDFGPLTHAAMVGALRRLGAASPVPIPSREQLMDAVAARAAAENAPWSHRPQTIRTSPEYGDVPLSWTAPTSAGHR